MGTIVFQGLQSCLESQMVESRTLRLRLSAPKPAVESGGWSFLQTLSDPTSQTQILKPAAASSYATKRSVSSLSDKSLELCTENLGSETGTDHVSAADGGSNYLFSSPSPTWEAPESAPEPNSPVSQPAAARSGNYKRSRSNSSRRGSGGFPPPLTTMRGPELVQVRRPHREGGRLVIEAVISQSQPSCFEAERIDGRLRLHVAVVKDSPEFDSSATATEEIAEGNGEEVLIREGEGEGEGEEEITERRRNNRNSNTAWRCKDEGGQNKANDKGMLNWEPFWVATASLRV
ncbi:unnamed protein product [Linum tenue]|uniref:FAF domain-containing protein n=1 Tax=Linum tenue TaxID=586396 RepID=A0AAV0P4Z3_9ROSI|nr:unnamed protein product [Linum tenue]